MRIVVLQLSAVMVALPGCGEPAERLPRVTAPVTVPTVGLIPRQPIENRPFSTTPVIVRYYLPTSPDDLRPSSVSTWGMAAPVVDGCSDPNAVVYDDAYVQEYVRRTVHFSIECGIGHYSVVTPTGEAEFLSGLDESYFGHRFRADDLLRFLRNRVATGGKERLFVVKDPEVAKLVAERRPAYPRMWSPISPWDRDTRTAISHLVSVKYKPVYPLLKALLHDPSLAVRGQAIFGLGQLAVVVPEAVGDIAPLLEVPEIEDSAAAALTMAGRAAVPTLITAMGHHDWNVRNRAVHALARMNFDDATPGLLAALGNYDPEVRSYGESVLHDMASRGVNVETEDFMLEMHRRLSDEDDGVRQTAAAALEMLKLVKPKHK